MKLINILMNFKRIWKAVQVSQSLIIDIIKNLAHILPILDFNKQQFSKLFKIITTKKLCLTFFI